MSSGGVNGKSISVVIVGSVLFYSGLKGYKITRTVHDLITGQNPSMDSSAATTDVPITGNDGAAAGGLKGLLLGKTPSSSTKIPNLPGPVVAAPPGTSAAANQQLGQMLASAYGWGGGAEWQNLIQLWDKESGWSNTADNPSSDAYGIAQALPQTKYPKAGRAPRLGGRSDPATQMRWGLSYIKSRYGSPSAAWSHEQQFDWY
jgi:resuscitation-promoting factor RpfB